jgi:hypothetical protein
MERQRVAGERGRAREDDWMGKSEKKHAVRQARANDDLMRIAEARWSSRTADGWGWRSRSRWSHVEWPREMKAGSAYAENLDFSGEMWRGMRKTDSMVIGLEKSEMYRQRSVCRVAGVVVAGCERTMVSG